MSSLALFRRRLQRLRLARRSVRLSAAASALLASLLVGLLGLWGLDLWLRLSRGQRLAALGLVALALVGVWRRLIRPEASRRETLLELALAVQRRHGIDSDLVAALQFEAAPQCHGGSPRLAQAVIDQMAVQVLRIDPFEGFSTRPALRRGMLAVGLITAVLFLSIRFPDHARAFWKRLLLADAPYPTRTRIVQVVIPPSVVLAAESPERPPRPARVPAGRPVEFLVACRGRLPSAGAVELRTDSGGGTARLDLTPLSLEQRKALLEQAWQQLQLSEGLEAGSAERAGRAALADRPRAWPWAVLELDAPQLARQWAAAKSPAERAAVQSRLQEVLAGWPGDAAQQTILTGRLERVLTDLEYRVLAGDAATAPGRLHALPLPIVDVELVARPPAYAAGVLPVQHTRQTQLAVLEGSRVELSVRCVNGKRLRSARLVLPGEPGRRWELGPVGPEGEVWHLGDAPSPLAAVRDDVRFEVEVEDQDGLAPDRPPGGWIRCLRDQPPAVWLSTIHRVVLPQASPAIQYRVTDDLGVAFVRLQVEVQRNAAEEAATPGTAHVPIFPPPDDRRFPPPARSELRGQCTLPLSRLGLRKGDRLKLVLEAGDQRSQNGQDQDPSAAITRSEPLVLDVTDESGVLAALAEADERAAQQLSELIQRQLEIGASP